MGLELSVVIPCRDEAARIGATIHSLLAEVDRLGVDAEVVVVDDGSVDGTAAAARASAGGDPRLRVLRVGRNHGKGWAVRTGAAVARAPVVLFCDADEATDLEAVGRFLAAADDPDVDLVVASRVAPGAEVLVPQPRRRRRAGRAFRALAAPLTGVADPQCGFKLLRRATAGAVLAQGRVDGFAFDAELLVEARRAGLTVMELPVRWRDRPGSRLRVLPDGLRMLVDLAAVALPGPRPRRRHRALAELIAIAPTARALVRAAEHDLLAPLPRPAPSLDLGCGDGSFAAVLGVESPTFGLDLDAADAAVAQRRGAYDGVVVADVAALPFRTGSLASVVANSTLEHTADPVAGLHEMARVARTGADVVVTVPTPALDRLLLGAPLPRYAELFRRISRHHQVHPGSWWSAHLDAAGVDVDPPRPYFGHAAVRAFDALHWLAAPVAIPLHAVTGRWVVAPVRARPLARLLAPLLAVPPPGRPGGYELLVGRRRARR